MLAVILLAVLIPQHPAKAWCASVEGCAVEIANIPLYVIAWLLSFVAGLLNDFVTATGTIIIPAVRESWTILRDFVNMLFILVLIIMAFGTIFDIQKYSWRSMLVPFLIAALLINFSFVIGEYTISIGNGLSSVFLKQIGATNLKDRIGQGLGMQKIITTKGKDLTGTAFSAIGGAASGLQQLITIGFFIIFGAIALMAMIAAFIFVFLRIPILWMFLIVSPIAWFGYTLPNIRAQTWGAWWRHFLQWVFFLPVYLFFLMFGFIFIAAKSVTTPLVESATLGQGALIVVNDIAFYVITLIFLAGGLWASFKVGGMAGSSAAKMMGGIEKGVKKYIPGSRYVRSIGAGVKEGLATKGAEIQEKGIPGVIGGAQEARLRQARWTERFGFGAARGAADRAKAEEIEKEFAKVKTLNLNQSQLNERVQGAKGVERTAALKLKAENGWLESGDLGEINKTVRELGERSAGGGSFIQSLKKGQFHEMAQTTAQKEDIFRRLEGVELKKAFGLDMAESRELIDERLATELLNLYEGDALETRKKVEEAVKNNIENFAKDKSQREAIITRAVTPTTTKSEKKLKELVAKTMVDKKEVDSWKLRRLVLEAAGGMNPTTGEALTVEGRELATKIKDGNVAIKEEGDYRKARPGISASMDLNSVQYRELEKQIIDGIKAGLIGGFGTEELRAPAVSNALYEGYTSGRLTPAEFNKALGVSKIDPATGKITYGKGKPDRKKREAVNELIIRGPVPYS